MTELSSTNPMMRPPASPESPLSERIPRPGSRGAERWPGRIDSRWIGWPATVLLFAGAALSLAAEQALRPALLLAWAIAYAATGFFAFFYALLFMAGSTWRRLAMLLFVLLLLTGQIALHMDAAQPRELMVHDVLVSRSASVEHLMAAGADALVGLLLLLHGSWLAFGSRRRFPGEEPSLFAEPERDPMPPLAGEQPGVDDGSDSGAVEHPSEVADTTTVIS